MSDSPPELGGTRKRAGLDGHRESAGETPLKREPGVLIGSRSTSSDVADRDTMKR